MESKLFSGIRKLRKMFVSGSDYSEREQIFRVSALQYWCAGAVQPEPRLPRLGLHHHLAHKPGPAEEEATQPPRQGTGRKSQTHVYRPLYVQWLAHSFSIRPNHQNDFVLNAQLGQYYISTPEALLATTELGEFCETIIGDLYIYI